MYLKSVFFTLVVLILSKIESARILAIYPTPSISHQVVFRPLTNELVQRGHEVVVITTDPFYPKGKAPTNLTEIDVHDISYKNWQGALKDNLGDKNDLLKQITMIIKRFSSTLDLQLGLPEVKDILKKDKKYFDLLIIEACNRPLAGISNIFDAPIIQFSSFGAVPSQYNLYGAPIQPFLFPTPGRYRLYNLTLWEKGLELFRHVALYYLFKSAEEYDYDVMRKHFGKDVATFKQLRNRLQMLFVNEHPIWSDNHPVGPNIVYIGGIHKPVPKELPKDLKTFLDNSKHGVIYISFGTNVTPSELPQEKIELMMKVLSQLPYDILFKWDQDKLPGQPDNVKVFKWFPQSDLLRHPNVKLFITQGGLQSTDETIDGGVPVIGIPMLGDQWYNVEKYVQHKIGLQLNIKTLTDEQFKEAIETVINNKSYKNNIVKLRARMRHVPIDPLELAVWWVHYILEHGGDHLRPPSFNMSWAEYYELPLVLAILSVIIISLTVVCLTLSLIFKAVYSLLFKKKSKLKRS